MRGRLSRAAAAVALLVCVIAGATVRADDDYPSRPITLVHGFGAGGNIASEHAAGRRDRAGL
jgi:tripartite-type tricarboxylate transporter receptor subunit TctC